MNNKKQCKQDENRKENKNVEFAKEIANNGRKEEQNKQKKC